MSKSSNTKTKQENEAPKTLDALKKEMTDAIAAEEAACQRRKHAVKMYQDAIAADFKGLGIKISFDEITDASEGKAAYVPMPPITDKNDLRCHILLTLAEKSMTQKETAKKLEIKQPNISASWNDLLETRLIKSTDPKRKRNIPYMPTAAGLAKIEELK
jgi:hypothetical protein